MGWKNNNNRNQFFLGSTIEINRDKNQNTEKYLGKNLKTELKVENNDSKEIFTIGLKDKPNSHKQGKWRPYWRWTCC